MADQGSQELSYGLQAQPGAEARASRAWGFRTLV